MCEKKGLIIGASIGNCVHVAGVVHFLNIAEKEGYETEFLGPAVSVDYLFEQIKEKKPSVVGISYRLTPDNVVPLLDVVDKKRKEISFDIKWVFGGTKPVAEVAKTYGFFSFISDGFDDINDSIRFLRGKEQQDSEASYANNIIDRIHENYPYPVLRHHYGRPSLEETVAGVKQIAEAKVLDVISLGPDQNAQEFFFHPERMKEEFSGAGGVPVRTREDFVQLKEASKCGNYPLMRCYSGTEDVFEYAKMLLETIENAWTAIPLCWYNQLDGRGKRPVEVAMKEAQELIHWHAKKEVTVEINEPHHWGLRDSHDVIAVAMAYVSAYNAKKLGVKNYIAQYMFNNPNGLSFSMDLAKIFAMIEMVESLHDENFKTYREVRTGLALLNADMYVAKGQLAASTFMQMVVKPHIIHVVGYCEADHAASAEEVIESCRIVKGVIRHCLEDSFSIEKDEAIIRRKEELISEAKFLLNFICEEYKEYEDPLANATVLTDCIKKGYIDAVHILKNDEFTGNLKTTISEGKCVAIDPLTREKLTEKERLYQIRERVKGVGK